MRALADVKDVDGDGKTEATIELTGNPFLDREVSMHLDGNITRPIRIVARTFDLEGPAAEGSTSKDTKGNDIVFAAGPEPIVEIMIQCTKPSGCTVDGGAGEDAASDGATAADAGSDTSADGGGQ